MLANQFRSPLILLLFVAGALALVVGDFVEASIIVAVLLTSALLGFVQEYRASVAVARLRERLNLQTTVLRDGKPGQVAAEEVVVGDVVKLSAGNRIPADARLLEANDLHLEEAILTGESFPTEKQPGVVAEAAGLPQRTNCVFMGTSVRSGTALAVVARTGRATSMGAIAERLERKAPETEFERGVRKFGHLILREVVVLVLGIVTANVFLHRPPVESLLFALALAIGLSPELLPTIITVTLARGAQQLAKKGVLVRRLNAIESLGSVDLLLTDKTGTLTRGVMALDQSVGPDGEPSPRVLSQAALNSRFQSGLANPLDVAILEKAKATAGAAPEAATKVDEIPYDFERKRMTVVVAGEGGRVRLISKGAVKELLGVCSRVRVKEAEAPLDSAARAAIEERFRTWSASGLRVLAVAARDLERKAAFTRADEVDLVLEGFLLFEDPPKPDAGAALAALKKLGVEVKVVTGDNRYVADHLARAVGIAGGSVLAGEDVDRLTEPALQVKASATSVFAEIDPAQKLRILEALRRAGHVVGFLGDGINDAPALHGADVGVSVMGAADVAKEAADIVLLEPDLGVLRGAILEGRRTFANTVKYINITTSANLGNMLSMASAVLFLPFLPLLPGQILLNNLLSDIPAVFLSSDNVDAAWTDRPHRWSIKEVRDAMIVFGLISSAFDGLTFGILLWAGGWNADLFRTGWFVESLLTELLVLLVLRTYLPAISSHPTRPLLYSVIAMAVLAVALPLLPIAGVFGFVALPVGIVGALVGVVVAYGAATEVAKRRFFRKFLRGQAA